MSITISESTRAHLQIVCFVWPIVQNRKIFCSPSCKRNTSNQLLKNCQLNFCWSIGCLSSTWEYDACMLNLLVNTEHHSTQKFMQHSCVSLLLWNKENKRIWLFNMWAIILWLIQSQPPQQAIRYYDGLIIPSDFLLLYISTLLCPFFSFLSPCSESDGELHQTPQGQP